MSIDSRLAVDERILSELDHARILSLHFQPEAAGEYTT